MPMIEIWDGSIRLADLVEHVSVTEDLQWTILEVWAVGETDEVDVIALEREAEASPHGLNLSASELRGLAAGLHQVIDGIFVGYRGQQPNRNDADLRSSAEVVLEAIDSTLWRVYAREVAMIDRLEKRFVRVCDVTPEVPIAPKHEMS